MWSLPRSNNPTARHQTGFSLVEVAVGMMIGAMGILLVLQTFEITEGQKRNLTGGGDAQTNGVIAMRSLESDIRHSGYGFNSVGLFGCNLQLRAGVVFPLVPVMINPPQIPPGDTNTDTLMVMYGGSDVAGQGDLITAAPPAGAPGNVYAVQAAASFQIGDQVVALPRVPAAPPGCDAGGNLLLDRIIGRNLPAATVTVGTGSPNMSNGRLYNLGTVGQNPARPDWPVVRAYAVRNEQLTVCDAMLNDCTQAASVNDETIWVPVVGNIVGLRALYGRDTAPAVPGQLSFRVVVYDQPPPFATSCEWVRVVAVRFVLVVRNSQYEKPNPKNEQSHVTREAPVWAGSGVAPILLDHIPNWRDYRYKVFESMVPLRNITWMGVPGGC